MNVIVRGRRSGKTSELIRKLDESPNSILITHNLREADRLQKMYPNLKWQIMTWEQYRSRHPLAGKSVESEAKIFIDNLDYILQSMFDVPIDTVAFNITQKPEDLGSIETANWLKLRKY